MGIFQNNLMGAAAAAASAGSDFYDHQIANSCRFDGSSSELDRTPGSAGNRRTFTFSTWIKKVKNGVQQCFFSAGSGTFSDFEFDSSDRLSGHLANGGTSFQSTALYRDPSAWYHFVVIMDTTQGTADDRCKVYINGERITAWNTDPASTISQNYDWDFNNNVKHAIGYEHTGRRYFAGYLADTYMVDGTAKAIGDCGTTKNGVWIPDDPSGFTFGTNGFLINYASSSDLGNDVSGNNNDFSASGLSAHDQMLDSPTFNSDSNGGNFCTLNGIAKQSTVTVTEGNLRCDSSNASIVANVESSYGFTSGKIYFEMTNHTGSNASYPVMTVTDAEAYNFDDTAYYGYGVNRGGDYIINASNTANVGSLNCSSTSDIRMFAIDFDNSKLWAGKNGTWYNTSGTSYTNSTGPESGNNYIVNGWDYNVAKLFTGHNDSSCGVNFNFGQDGTFAGNKTAQGNSDATGYGNFYYTVPDGFLAVCSGNQPVADAVDPAQTDDNYPQALYDSKIWTGGGTSTAVSGLGFQPDFVWIKERENSSTYGAFNSTMGNTKLLGLGMTAAAEVNQSADPGLESFDSDGFTVDYPNTADFYVNRSGEPYIAWNWRANGGTTSTNSTGSVNVTQQVDPSGAFSISTYTGAGGTGNIGHGLSSAATFVIVKQTNGVNNYCVYAKGAQDSGALFAYMDTNSVFQSATIFGNTEPSSTLVYLGDNNEVNHTSRDYIAWCWANVEGYCRSGYYTGNADTDGTSVYLGFRPAFLMVRYIGSGESWVILDDARDGYNVTNKNVRANSSNAEASGSTYNIDFLSNGFKPRTTWEGLNGNGYRIVYIAMAHNPFKYATAR